MNIQLKEEWLEKVKITNRKEIFDNGRHSVNTELYLAPAEIKADYDVNYTAAIVGQEFFWNLDSTLVQNKDFIIKLVNDGYTKNRSVFSYLHGDLSYDLELFKMCIDNKDKLVWSINKKLIEQRDAMLDIFKTHDIFNKLENTYDLDKEFMQIHLNRHPDDFKNMRKSMQNYFGAKSRKAFVINLMTKAEDAIYIYPYISSILKEDLEVIDVLLSKNRNNIDSIPKDLLNDKSFMLYAIDKYNCNINKCSDEIKQDEDIIKLRISKHGHELLNYPQFRENLEFIHLAMKTYPNLDLLTKQPNPSYYNSSKSYINKHNLLSNKELVLKFLKADSQNCNKLLQETDLYEDDYDIVKLNVLHDSELLKRSAKWKNDTELSQISLLKSDDITLLSPELFKNKDLVLDLLIKEKKNNSAIFHNYDFIYLYRQDRNIIKQIISSDPTLINRLPEAKADEEYVYFALQHGLKEAKYIDTSLYTNKQIMRKFLDLDFSNNYPLLPLCLKNDKEFALETIKQNKLYYDYIVETSSFYNSLDFHIELLKQQPNIYDTIPKKSPFKLHDEIVYTYLSYEDVDKIKVPDMVFDYYGLSNIEELKAKLGYKILENKVQQKEELSTYKKVKI